MNATEEGVGFLRRQHQAGEFVLRFARSEGLGERKFLSHLFRNSDRKFMAEVLVAEQVEEEVGEGFSFADLFQWLKDNPETVKKIIAMIMTMFNPKPE